MPVVLTTAYSQAEDALSLARALLNDSAASCSPIAADAPDEFRLSRPSTGTRRKWRERSHRAAGY